MSSRTQQQVPALDNRKALPRKGIGGLSSEKKKLLKQLITQKAADDLRKQKDKEAEERRQAIESRVPKLNLNGLTERQLQLTVRELHNAVCRLEEEKYEWESRLQKQNYEMQELNMKVNDIKGHFVKPVLKKVSKSDHRFQMLLDSDRLRGKLVFLTALKSTGRQTKFVIGEHKDRDNVLIDKQSENWRKDELSKPAYNSTMADKVGNKPPDGDTTTKAAAATDLLYRHNNRFGRDSACTADAESGYTNEPRKCSGVKNDETDENDNDDGSSGNDGEEKEEETDDGEEENESSGGGSDDDDEEEEEEDSEDDAQV